MRPRQRSPAQELSDLADRCLRSSVLLAAGVSPMQALDTLSAPIDSSLMRARSRSSAQEGPRAALSAALAVASRSGAPLAATLTAVSISLSALADAAREVEIAAVGPRLTTRVVASLPLVGAGISVALGFDVAGALFGSPLGWAFLVAGLALSALGIVWSRRLLHRATPRPEIAGLTLDLTAIALSGGMPSESAIALAAREAELRSLDRGGSEHARRIVAFGRRSGAGIVPLLRSEAMLVRREQAAQARALAERLSVTLLLPLAACVLPAFVLLGVAPALLAVMSSTVLSR